VPAAASAPTGEASGWSPSQRLSFARENLRDEVLDSLQDGLPPNEILSIVQRALAAKGGVSKRPAR
jgi:hypothetical protein